MRRWWWLVVIGSVISRAGEARLPMDGRRVGTVEGAAAMSSPRAAHTATALPDGRVLVAGGAAAPTSAELFDPHSGRYTPVTMRRPRHSHTATVLADGRVLIAGGYVDGEPVSHVELFDPSTGRFTDAGSMRAARAGHIAVRLDDGTVLLAGGVGPGWTFLQSAERFDPRTGRFSPTGSLSVPRESHVAVLLTNGEVLVIGGHAGRRAQMQLYASTERYDPRRGSFRRAGSMRIARHKHDAVRLADGRVLVTAGSDSRDELGQFRSTEVYDPGTDAFASGPELAVSRYKHQGTSLLLPDGRVLVAGGASQPEVVDIALGRADLLPVGTPMAGAFSAAAALPGGGALITGGYGHGGGPRSLSWRYRPQHPERGRW